MIHLDFDESYGDGNCNGNGYGMGYGSICGDVFLGQFPQGVGHSNDGTSSGTGYGSAYGYSNGDGETNSFRTMNLIGFSIDDFIIWSIEREMNS